MLKELIKLANDLDQIGMVAQANLLDDLIRQAQEDEGGTNPIWRIPYGRKGTPRSSKGMGFRREFAEVPADPEDSCEECDGDGKIVKVHECPACDGTGMGAVIERYPIPPQRSFPPDPWEDHKIHRNVVKDLTKRHEYEKRKPRYVKERDLKEISQVGLVDDMVSLANLLDAKGFQKEADLIDNVILKLSQEVHVDEAGVEWKNMGEADFPSGHIIWKAQGHPQKRLKKGMKPSSKDYHDSPTVAKSPVTEKIEEAEKAGGQERDLAGNLEHYLGWVSEGLRGSGKD